MSSDPHIFKKRTWKSSQVFFKLTALYIQEKKLNGIESYSTYQTIWKEYMERVYSFHIVKGLVLII